MFRPSGHRGRPSQRRRSGGVWQVLREGLQSLTLRNNNRVWFRVGRSRIGLLKTPEGQQAGVNHFCVSAEPFNYDAVAARLAALGAKVEPPELPGAPSFRDPDGMLVQVSAAA